MAALAPCALALLDMQAHSQEQFAKHGVVKDIYVVVKGSPFHVLVGSAGRPLNLAKVAFDASLVYDCEGNKTVDFVKSAPLEFKYSPSAGGEKVEMEFRLKVLTSQHEDMLFKIRVQALDPLTRAPLAGMTLLTPSIKVISKPEQLKKRTPTAAQQAPTNKKRAVATASSAAAAAAPAVSDVVIDTLGRLEARQEEANRLLERILSDQFRAAPIKPEHGVPGAAPVADFEHSFDRMARAFVALRPEERADAIRRLASASRDTSALAEMVDMFSVEGLRREPVSGSPPQHLTSSGSAECRCTDCPHKQELDRVDGFYQRFLESGMGLPEPASDLCLDQDAQLSAFLTLP